MERLDVPLRLLIGTSNFLSASVRSLSDSAFFTSVCKQQNQTEDAMPIGITVSHDLPVVVPQPVTKKHAGKASKGGRFIAGGGRFVVV